MEYSIEAQELDRLKVWRYIADDIYQHRQILKLLTSLTTDEQQYITKSSHLEIFQALTKEWLLAMKQKDVTRSPDNQYEMYHYRGRQHKQLNNAITSFLADVKRAYSSRLFGEETKLGDHPNLITFFTQDCLIKTNHYAIIDGFSTSNDYYFFVYHQNAKAIDHVQCTITVKRGVANNYSGTCQTIAHRFSIESSLSDLSPEDIMKTINVSR